MIKIICLGKIKENYLINGIEEYKKRIAKYHNIEIYELQDEGIKDKINAQRKEKERILKILDKKDYLITLEIDGQEISSLDFAKKIDQIFISYSNITFIIGGSYGLDDEIKKMLNKIEKNRVYFIKLLEKLECIANDSSIDIESIEMRSSNKCVFFFFFFNGILSIDENNEKLLEQIIKLIGSKL